MSWRQDLCMVDLILKIINLGGCHYYCIKCKVVLNILSNCRQPQCQHLQNLMSYENSITLYTRSTSVSSFLAPLSLKSFLLYTSYRASKGPKYIFPTLDSISFLVCSTASATKFKILSSLHASYGASKGPKYMFATSYSISVSCLFYP